MDVDRHEKDSGRTSSITHHYLKNEKCDLTLDLMDMKNIIKLRNSWCKYM